VLRFGRIKSWLHHGGRKSRMFINAGPIGVDADRVVLGAERDGVAELRATALPGFAVTVLRTFERDTHGIDRVPANVAFHAGRVVLVWTTREDTRLVRDDDAVMPGPLESCGAVGGATCSPTTSIASTSATAACARRPRAPARAWRAS
jgi:hypothetical protein